MIRSLGGSCSCQIIDCASLFSIQNHFKTRLHHLSPRVEQLVRRRCSAAYELRDSRRADHPARATGIRATIMDFLRRRSSKWDTLNCRSMTRREFQFPALVHFAGRCHNFRRAASQVAAASANFVNCETPTHPARPLALALAPQRRKLQWQKIYHDSCCQRHTLDIWFCRAKIKLLSTRAPAEAALAIIRTARVSQRVAEVPRETWSNSIWGGNWSAAILY